MIFKRSSQKQTSKKITWRFLKHPSLLQFGRDLTVEILHVLEFTSERKRMSVVARLPDGKIRVMVKGAVSTFLGRARRQRRLI